MGERREDPISKLSDLHSHFHEAMRPIADIQRELQRAMKPFADIQKHIDANAIPVLRGLKFDSAVQKFIDDHRRLAKSIENLNLGPIKGIAKRIAQIWRNMQALDDAGWLPHYSTPFTLVEECYGDTAGLRERLVKHYQDGWQSIRQDIASRLASYDIDEEAKVTFREALTAHETGLYRCVCRVLFPEIERVTRIELHGGKLESITSQRLLRELAKSLTPASIEPKGFYALNLFRRLNNHLYQPIKTQADWQRFTHDPVPNRHATVHGLVIYSSMQNSINTIFAADYIFQVIYFLKQVSATRSG